MYAVKITGFQTKAQAEEFIKWYEGQGEQDISIWLECRKQEGKIDNDSLLVDMKKTFPLKWKENTVEMFVEPS